MKAYDIAGKRRGAGIEHMPYAERLGWDVRTLRDVERGFVEITEEQHAEMLRVLAEMSAEQQEAKEVTAA